MYKKIIFIITIIFLVNINSLHSQDIIDLTTLSEGARSNNYLSKLFAIDLLGDVADENYRNFFIITLNNEKDRWIRFYAAQALCNLKIDQQIKFELKKMLTDKENEPWLRIKIAEMLYDKTGEKLFYRNEKDAIVEYVKKEKKNDSDKKDEKKIKKNN